MPGSRPHFSAAVSNWRIAMRNELRSSVVLMGTGTRALAIIEDSFPPTMGETQAGGGLCASSRRGAIYTPKSMGQVNHRDQRAIAGEVEAPGGAEPPTRSLGIRMPLARTASPSFVQRSNREASASRLRGHGNARVREV